MTETVHGMERTMSRAYALIDRLNARLEARDSEPIAVVGMACRFPGGVRSPEDFWQLLVNARDGVGEVPANRWSMDVYDPQQGTPGRTHSRWGGFVDGIEYFDPDFFGISRREAEAMDPQQRQLLEVSWEALENAHVPPPSLAGQDCGVWTAMCSNDYKARAFAHPGMISPYAATGNANSIAAGRLSYLLDLRGPSVAVDTACSSSLVAIHQACASLRQGEVSTAICGAVNVVLSPATAIAFSQFPSMLAADGRCKTFDSRADGFVRSEGCGVVVLKRLSDAVADGDRIRGVIRASVLNQDGRSSGLTAPNGVAQRTLLEESLRRACLEPKDITYVETHGAGTKLGDPIEVDALRAVLGECEGDPLYLGAVKTNLGHLEAAAGMAGLIKTLLVLEKGVVPANLHFEELNEFVNLAGSRLRVPTCVTAFPKPCEMLPRTPRRAVVSSFGFSGTNGQLVVEEYVHDREDSFGEPSDEAQLMIFSAPTERALARLARRYGQRCPEDASIEETCRAISASRATFGVRAAAVVRSREEMLAALDDVVDGKGDVAQFGELQVPEERAVFLFTGQGPQQVGMGLGLYESSSVVRGIMDRCDAALGGLLGLGLLDVMHGRQPEAENLIQDMSFAQPAMVALELATAHLWCDWGLRPTAVMGHSLGEYAAACFAGVLTIEDVIPLVARRGQLLQRLATSGAMVSLEASEAEVAECLREVQTARTAIAAMNGTTSTVVSGPLEEVQRVMEVFQSRSRRVKRLPISTSSHSPLVEKIIPELEEALSRVDFGVPQVPLISNTTGEFWPVGAPMMRDYWIKHARQPVRFMDGVRTLEADGERLFIEMGPARTLLGLVADSLVNPDESLLVASLGRSVDDRTATMQAMADLFVNGVDLEWGRALGGRGVHVDLPNYPFEKVRCWQDLPIAERSDEGWTPVPTASGFAPVGEAHQNAPVGPAAAAPSSSRRRRRATMVPAAADLELQPAAQQHEWLTAQLGLAVAQVMGSRGNQPSHDQPLIALGIDSLMAVELRNDIRTQLGVTVPIAEFLGGATLSDLAAYILAHQGESNDEVLVDSPLQRRAASNDAVVTSFLDQIESSEVRA